MQIEATFRWGDDDTDKENMPWSVTVSDTNSMNAMSQLFTRLDCLEINSGDIQRSLEEALVEACNLQAMNDSQATLITKLQAQNKHRTRKG